jgi:hypothetical protein
LVLTPLTKEELNLIFDKTSIDVLKFYINKSLFFQPELLKNQAPFPIQVPKEHMEQWLVQAIGAEPVGSGNYPIDIVKPGEFGADVKTVTCKYNSQGVLSKNLSNEVSLMQNFKECGNQLDYLFKEKEYQKIVEEWKLSLFNKLAKITTENNIPKIYYIFLIKGFNVFHICIFNVNVDNIKNLSYNYASSTNLHLNGFIDENIGETTIYKSKKRLELRLFTKYLVENNYTIELSFKYNPQFVDLRELIVNNKINDYIVTLVSPLYELF